MALSDVIQFELAFTVKLQEMVHVHVNGTDDPYCTASLVAV